MREVINYLKARYLSEKAQGIAEYALLLAFIVVVAAALMTNTSLQTAITGTFDKISTKISGTNL